MLGTELQMKKSLLRPGVQWLFVLLLLASRVLALYAQSPSDANFLATLGELRDASFDDKDKIVDQLAQSGHPNARAVLTAFGRSPLLPQRRHEGFLVKSAAGEDTATLDLIDPVTLKSAGPASVDDLTKIGTNNHLRRVLQTTLARFGLSSTDPSVRLDAVRRHGARLRRRQRAAAARPQAWKPIPELKRKLPRLWRSLRWMVRMRRRVSPQYPRFATASARMC
jgi:hypothetical protein